MSELSPLVCEAPDGQVNTFYWSVEDNSKYVPKSWVFRVRRTNPPNPKEEFVQVTVKELTADTVYIDTITNHNAEWAKKMGISEAIFPQIKNYLNLTIVSSRALVSGGGEWQTDNVKRMWNRFCSNGIAILDPEQGRYVFCGVKQNV